MWQSLITVQTRLGHDPLIGRRLYPLLTEAGFDVMRVTPRSIYTDGNNAQTKSDSLNKIMIPMLESAKQHVLDLNLVDLKTWDRGIGDFHRSAKASQSTFFYSWFKALAFKE